MAALRFLAGLAVVAGFFVSAAPSEALILYGHDNSGNTTAPGNAAPWEYVARLDANGVFGASGVYLGNGYILTANHVIELETAFLNGTFYTVDTTFAPLQLDDVDLKLIRILGDPMLDPLPLVGDLSEDRAHSATVIGWGVGKGAEVPDQGWYWGGNSTRAERWGTNTTLNNYAQDAKGHLYLMTTFDRSAGSNESSLTLGDSGGGLFEYIDNEWQLAGLSASVDQLIDGASTTLYDASLSLPGDQMAKSYYVQIRPYSDVLNATVAAAPEPSSAYLFAVCGAVLMGGWRYRRQRIRGQAI